MMLRFSLTSLALWSTVLPFAQVAAFSPGMKGHRECASKLQMASTASTEETLTVTPIKSLDGTVTLPGSKSLSNRCLLLAALSEGNTRVDNLLESDDIRYMLEALDTLQVPVEKHSSESVTVTGQAGPINSPKSADETVDLFLGNAGTAMRPLAAALCMGRGKFVLDGVPRMRERPIADLIDGLRQLGADVTCVDETGCPPVTINAEGLKGGEASISGKMSSQFLSSLLMASPAVDGDVVIKIKDELISAPYVALTIGLMKKFGVAVEIEGSMDGQPTFTIARSEKYTSPGSILVEGDASSASYFIAGAAITGGTVVVRGCGSESVQGDVAFADVMEQMGATVTWGPESITVTRDPSVRLKGVDVDCGKIPDAAMTLAVAALFAEGPTTIRNVYSWRLKETERMKAIVAECTKLGAEVEEFEDYCIIHPPEGNKLNDNVLIETYDDHRMAMTFSLAACGGVSVIINDPGCTAKTFPTYFDILESIATH
uniref:3-phosphoshikimate 1-carboxyvinyltransferase n=2 Tax=Pseudo-nitzschia australis TaxID=44445 RepID=A0A7S4EPZ1_9STRA|mmetsp:Transcript_849/g.1957  ORF Transcript_849/g.1957 Transcript_849/m.1957 type:complete len:488 (+) Transcript_849:233-1696(+)